MTSAVAAQVAVGSSLVGGQSGVLTKAVTAACSHKPYISGSNVRIRWTPSFSGRVVGTAQWGETVQIGNWSGEWAFVTFPNRWWAPSFGWVHYSLIRFPVCR